ncbi:hypothetical protein KSC_062000 [Ktedonobacter sp. SOSP1-52]|uniref:hypothetical protein n=1 Tax=Ktedonobacter sp. SOSP1-52 TaxID=2778366 RepID=UPI001915428C|nr:hypothetical protein [Ktedonobacter sp. SOSP1-52]GHO67308.1 hypothetical protein KSC_062000 [Ktedonobacter sp. SOSP1-52]
MAIQFLRGNSQAPKGHAIFVVRNRNDANNVFCTYCIIPPIPMSIAKYIPPLLAAHLPTEELQDSDTVSGMPIPPIPEEGQTLEYMQLLAEHRDDDLCDIGSVSSRDDMARMNLAAEACQEYGQLYTSYIATIQTRKREAQQFSVKELDADSLVFHAMPERQKLAELGKLIGTARYAIEGHDQQLLRETEQQMQRIAGTLAEKYRGSELVTAAISPNERGARLSGLYLSRAYKLLDEEYADIPGIERDIRELKDAG